MCGILGAAVTTISQNNLAKYNYALHLIHRRGPDDSGFEILDSQFGKLFLGHTRLSILDLSSLGHQPMISKDQRYHIVFNGEIYNYIELRQELKALGNVFESDSDTEVLLCAWQTWGEGCLNRLDGMFAFAIFDSLSNKLFCVRDPFGIKPFYYSADQSTFFFSSDVNAVRAMLPSASTLNLQSALTYLFSGTYDTNSETFFYGLEQILPGELLTVSYDTNKRELVYQSRKWFNLDLEANHHISFEQARDQLREEFLLSVRKQLRSDVPVGAALSGGIDSSSVICAIRYLDKTLPINSFSYIASGSDLSEEKWVDLVVEKAKLKSHKIDFSEPKLLADLIDFITAHGEPLAGLSYFAEFNVYRLAKASGIKVMLDGHGADEAIGGYRGYPAHRVQSLLERHQYIEAISFLKHWVNWPGNNVRAGTRAFLKGVHGALNFPARGMPFLAAKMSKVIKPEYKKLVATARNFSFGNLNLRRVKGRALVTKLAEDLTATSCPHQLKGADRSAMWHSIENRVPFLSPSFVRCALSMPEEFLVSRAGQTKFLFREAMRGIVPDQILDRRDKIGYAAKPGIKLPMTQELRAELNDGFDRLFFLDRKAAMSILCCADGSVRLDGNAWRIFNLLLWSRIYNVTLN